MQLLTGKLPTLTDSFSNRKYLLLPSHIGTFDVISGLCSVKLSLYIIRKRTLTHIVMSVGMERLELSRHYWHQILSLECLHSTTPHKSKIYSSQRDQENLGEKLARSAIAAHPLPLSTTWLMGCGRRGTRTPEPQWERIYSPLQLPLCDPPRFHFFKPVSSLLNKKLF